MDYYMLKGDLLEITIQKEELLKNGIETGPENKYPVVKKEEDYKKALVILSTGKIDGWEKYKNDYITYDICTTKELHEKIVA